MFSKRIYFEKSVLLVSKWNRDLGQTLTLKHFGEISVGEFPIGEFSIGEFFGDEFTLSEFTVGEFTYTQPVTVSERAVKTHRPTEKTFRSPPVDGFADGGPCMQRPGASVFPVNDAGCSTSALVRPGLGKLDRPTVLPTIRPSVCPSVLRPSVWRND